MMRDSGSHNGSAMIADLVDEYNRYRKIGEKALAQTPARALNVIHAPDGNSAAMIVAHMSGNLKSRFTDFLTTDGEKPWRNRDEEFENRECTRAEVGEMWNAGWSVLEAQLNALTDADLSRVVTIRGQPLSVHAALCRSSAHVAYHVGQLVLIARLTADTPWQWISIPKGDSIAYNADPKYEKGPR
ncbi:MAG: DUF1572 family protein [bacterium]